MAGALLGVLMMLLVVPRLVAWRKRMVGLSVGMSLLAITTLAPGRCRVPLLFDRMGLDPALMYPFITTCTDVAGR